MPRPGRHDLVRRHDEGVRQPRPCERDRLRRQVEAQADRLVTEDYARSDLTGTRIWLGVRTRGE
jgi:hypothetical protein